MRSRLQPPEDSAGLTTNTPVFSQTETSDTQGQQGNHGVLGAVSLLPREGKSGRSLIYAVTTDESSAKPRTQAASDCPEEHEQTATRSARGG